MEVILASGYRPREVLGIDQDEIGTAWIDAQIVKLQRMGLTPLVVLAGPHCDQILLQSAMLESCELIYDGHHEESNLFTNVCSGLKATERACFAIPVEVPVPSENYWKQLKLALNHQGYETRNHLLQIGGEGAPWQYGFPLLVTPAGRRLLLHLKDLKGLTDPRLNYFFSTPPALAQDSGTL